VRYRSNPKFDRNGNLKQDRKGVQIRMDREAKMLESYNCPGYKAPGAPANNVLIVKVGKTVVPYSFKKPANATSKSCQYYIWRTKKDRKVRMAHRFFEGKMFHVDRAPAIGHPGSENDNCRCEQDFNIPDFVVIEDDFSDVKSKVTKYIANLFDIQGFMTK
jgi:hypothetical protein